jgi:hypothetical protein
MSSGKRLYDALGVEPSASASDIKKAYHRKALTCHPDKVGQAGEAEFKRISEAYTVLSDAQKRAMYDKHGEQGLEFMNNDMAAPVADQLGLSLMLQGGAVLVLFTAICALILTSNVAAKLDGKLTSWSWATTLYGLWMWEAAVMLVVVTYMALVVNSLIQDGENSRANLRHVAIPCVVLLYFAFTVMLGVNLDHHSMKWIEVAAPFLAGEFFIILASLRTVMPSEVRQSLHISGLTNVASYVVPALIAGRVVSLLVRPAMAILIALQADGVLKGSAMVPALPMIVAAASGFLQTWVIVNLHIDNGRAAARDRVNALVSAAFTAAMVLYTAITCALRVDGSIGWKWGTCLTCVFAVEIGMLVSGCALLFIAAHMKSQHDRREAFGATAAGAQEDSRDDGGRYSQV